MGFWHRMKVRLGLEEEWDDEEYYGDDEYDDDDPAEVEDDYSRKAPYQSPYGAGTTGVKVVDRGPDIQRAREGGSGLRSVPTGAASVTPVAPQVRVHKASPKSFSEAQTIADKFKQGNTVVLDLSFTAPDLAKRILDFASGLTYGLDGGLEKVNDKAFMLTPHNVEVSDTARRRISSNDVFGGE